MAGGEHIALKAFRDPESTAQEALTDTFSKAEEVDPGAAARLRKLDWRPNVLENPMLLLSFLFNVLWIIVLVFARSINPARPLQGNSFLLDGYFGGYVASFAKFLATSQIIALGQIMPFCSMASEIGSERRGFRTLLADYYPYDWPIPRLRPVVNGHFYLFAVNLATFVSSYTIVQFASNILQEAFDVETGESLGWIPNLGIIYIVIACHSVFALTTLTTVVWLWNKKTGLITKPGSIAMLLAMLKDSHLEDDFQGLDLETSSWKVKKRLGENEYKVGYWKGSSGEPVYGLRRTGKRPVGRDNNPTRIWPRFNFVPWFVRPCWMIFWTIPIAAALSIALSLSLDANVLEYGFEPHASTEPLPIVLFSSAGFLWSFFPSLVADQYQVLCENIDMFYRTIQPYWDLQSAGQGSRRSLRALTINYAKDLPIIITFRALFNGHWRVATVSVLSFASSFVPALAANIFYADPVYQRVYVLEVPFILTIAFMGFLLVALIALSPDERSHLPHDLETLSDHISFLYMSNLMNVEEFKIGIPKVSPQVEPETSRGNCPIQMKKLVVQTVKNISESVKGANWKSTSYNLAKSSCPWLEPEYERELGKQLNHHVEARKRCHEPPLVIGFGVLARANDIPAVRLATNQSMSSLYQEDELKLHFWKKFKEDFVL